MRNEYWMNTPYGNKITRGCMHVLCYFMSLYSFFNYFVINTHNYLKYKYYSIIIFCVFFVCFFLRWCLKLRTIKLKINLTIKRSFKKLVYFCVCLCHQMTCTNNYVHTRIAILKKAASLRWQNEWYIGEYVDQFGFGLVKPKTRII